MSNDPYFFLVQLGHDTKLHVLVGLLSGGVAFVAKYSGFRFSAVREPRMETYGMSDGFLFCFSHGPTLGIHRDAESCRACCHATEFFCERHRGASG